LIHTFLSKYDWNERVRRKESPSQSAKLKQDKLAYIKVIDQAEVLLRGKMQKELSSNRRLFCLII
jgi:hypothetical protein